MLKHPLLYVWLAIAGALVIAGNLPDRVTFAERPAQAERGGETKHPSNGKEGAGSPSAGKKDAVDPRSQEQDCASCSEHEKADLYEQRRMAEAAERQVLVGVGGLVALIVTLILNWQATKAATGAALAAKDQADAARRAYVAEHRAWLKLYPVEAGPVIFKDDKVRVRFVVRVENISREPAVNIRVSGKPYKARLYVVARTGVQSLIQWERRLLLAQVDMPSIALMPNETHDFSFSAEAETDPATEAKLSALGASGPAIKGDSVNLTAAMVAFYKSASTDDWHHTAHAMWLTKVDGTGFDPSLGDVFADNIRFRIMSSEGEIT